VQADECELAGTGFKWTKLLEKLRRSLERNLSFSSESPDMTFSLNITRSIFMKDAQINYHNKIYKMHLENRLETDR